MPIQQDNLRNVPLIYRSTPGCAEGCRLCELRCAVATAVAEFLGRELHEALNRNPNSDEVVQKRHQLMAAARACAQLRAERYSAAPGGVQARMITTSLH